MTEKMIRDAYCKIRTIDQTIPDDVLDFMKDASIEKLKQVNFISSNTVLADSDIFILLERKFPTVYEIHRKEIKRAENLILTTTDKEFAERLVGAYNHYA